MAKVLNFVLLFALLLQSCHSTKQEVESHQTPKKRDTLSKLKQSMSSLIEDKLIEEGYDIGIVKYVENSDCPYVIYNENSKVQFDPINFDSTEFASFKSNDLKVYFKYRPLRRMNRCNEASPIELVSIKKRED